MVRNGYISTTPSLPIKNPKKREKYKIGYFGTIASWFDFKLLRDSLECKKNIEYYIIGPVSDEIKKTGSSISPKLVFKGPVEHDKLSLAVKELDQETTRMEVQC